MMISYILLILFSFITIINGHLTQTIFTSEMFSTKIDSTLFNFTKTNYNDNFNFRPSLEGYPDLPSWMRYMYSTDYHTGYLYGTPPKHTANTELRIEIVALNWEDYETNRILFTIHIQTKRAASHILNMKIDNLNWIQMMDPGRMENLKNIFREDLWKDCAKDLHVVFMESAINMGSRMPLMPQNPQGVIIHLGSDIHFSKEILNLKEEVKPLYKMKSCNFKKTTVQRKFQDAGFTLDWCAFKTIGPIEGSMSHQSSEASLGRHRRLDQWRFTSKNDAPQRNYIDEIAFSLAIPAMILTILITILTTVLCFQHDKIKDEYSDFFIENIFHLCEEYKFRKHLKTPTVQMVQYSDTTHQPVTTTTLKSLKDTPNFLVDNLSLRSQSPSNSVYLESSPKCNNYMRPKPPPYFKKNEPVNIPSSSSSSALQTNGIDI